MFISKQTCTISTRVSSQLKYFISQMSTTTS
uniref:Uncharacterized protein n=1 Tax=Arundo donax TaxID=35708 RepID=A0A0A9F2Q7_ARUDO